MRKLIVSKVDRPESNTYFTSGENGLLDWDTLLWRFAAERSYWLASATDRPHTMPVWGVWHDSRFWFSTHPNSKKARNLRNNAFANVHQSNTESVFILECTVEQINDQVELQQFVNEYNPKYRWDFKVEDVLGGVFALTPYKAFAWASAEGEVFHNTGTRFNLQWADD